MSNSNMDWANLDSRNERVAAATAPKARLVAAPVTATTPAAEPGSAAGPEPHHAADPGPDQAPPGTGRHHRGSRGAAVAAVAAAALACALAVPVAASAAHSQPAAAKSWKIVKTVPGGSPNFTAVTATSSSSAWAFEAFPASVAKPAAWRRTGSTWATVSFPGRAGEQVSAAGSSAASDVWAITTNGSKSRALRWNGSSWAATGTFRTDIGAVTVLNSHDVWAFATSFFPSSGGAWHYNGHAWSRVASGHGLTAGSALSHTSVWAVGGKEVAHWNGHAWARTSVASLLPANTALSRSSVVGIYAQSASSVWAVGTGGRQDEGGPTVVLHYNGHTWSRAAIRNSNNPVQVIPDGSGGLWIPVPSTNGIPCQMLRYSHGHLAPVSLPGGGGRKLNVLAVAAIPNTASAFGVGFTHRTDNLGLGVAGVILQYKR